MRFLSTVGLLAACATAAVLPGCAAPGGSAEPAAEEGTSPDPRRAVVILAGDALELERELREGWIFDWVLPRRDDWEVTLEAGGPRPSSAGEADATVVASLLPLPEELRGLVSDLPLRLGGNEVVFDGTRYGGPEVSVSVRIPGTTERWLVAAPSSEAVVGATNRTLARLLGGIHFSDELRAGDGPVDYELRTRPWRRRRGRWLGPGPEGRYGIDPAADRDDFAARERWRESLRPVGSGPVRLLVPPAEEGSREFPGLTPELTTELATDLARAAEAMAPALPLDSGALRSRPVALALEADHVAQIHHADAVGLAVPGEGAGHPDLHVVQHPDDRWAYRHAVARVLLERSGAADGRPPWLVEGAALWLSSTAGQGGTGGWYGRPYRDWLPDLAAAGALPDAEVLLDPEGPRGRSDGSEVLWTPAAAAVLAHLPGETAAEKLAGARRAAVEEALGAVEREAARDGGPTRAGGGGTSSGAVAAGSGRASPELPARFLRGVSLAMSNSIDGGYHAPAVGERLDELAALGADAVSLMPFAYQPEPDAPELRFLNGSPASETDVGLLHAARQAHRRGFTVLWKPHVWIGHGHWPGDVAMTSEADWRDWWRTYRRYVLHHAVLAAYARAELFAVGVELERTVERREDWEALIRDVRRFFPGAVTYAANWGRGAQGARFWGALDAVGVDAYYPLVDGGPDRTDGAAGDPTEAELARGAAAVADRLEALARRTGKPVLLTEVGFANRKAPWLAPHEEDGETSPEDQARAYRALLEALEGRPWLRGVFVWKVMTGDRHRPGLEASAFRFLGHPAEAVVAGFFRRQAAPEAAGGL